MGVCFLIFGAWAIWNKLGVTIETIEIGQWVHVYPGKNYANLLFPVALFGTLMILKPSVPLWIARLAPFSFGMFLCHPIFLDFFLVESGGGGRICEILA